MRILGISCYFHDAAAALIENGVLVAAAEEERFTRIKHDFEFPKNSIDFCLRHSNISGKDLDYVVFFEKPFVKFDRLLRTALEGFPNTYAMFVQSMRTWLLDKLWIKNLIARNVGVDRKNVLFSDHHMSHAASSYFCSPFDDSAVLTFDGVGEWSTTTMGIGRGSDLTISKELNFPHSIGLLYSAFTAFLGFEVNEGEYKVMGMAPYGRPQYTDKVWQTVRQSDDGAYKLDSRYFSFHHSTKNSYTRNFLDLFGEPRKPDVDFFVDSIEFPSYFGEKPRNYEELCRYNQHYADIAASVQSVTEDLILGVARELQRETKQTRLCLAGGVALNSVANGRILRETQFEEIYIQPSAGDGGGALGAALFAWNCALGNSERFVMDHAYWGQSYDDEEIKSAISASGIKTQHFDDLSKLEDIVVQQLTDGKVVSLFNGRFEWGPRALGNRSILADPRSAGAKDLVNTKIKFREPFRPFAPAVTAEACTDYFELPDPDAQLAARLMLLVVPVKEDKQDLIPAVSHMGTARIQTVYPDANPRYYQLIRKFGDSTGVPVLMNTSFNVRGEPIVNSPADALNTFANSGIDSLVMGDFLLDKA